VGWWLRWQLKGADFARQLDIVYALEKAKDLIELLESPGIDEHVRAHAIKKLGDTGDPGVIAVLTRFLRSDKHDERENAVEALGSLRTTQAVDVLLSLLGDTGFSDPVAVIRVLEWSGDPRAIPPLLEALLGAEEELRRPIVQALERLGWKPSSGRGRAIVAVAEREYERAAAEGVEAVEPLLQACHAHDWHTASSAGDALCNVLESHGKDFAGDVIDTLAGFADRDTSRHYLVDHPDPRCIMTLDEYRSENVDFGRLRQLAKQERRRRER